MKQLVNQELVESAKELTKKQPTKKKTVSLPLLLPQVTSLSSLSLPSHTLSEPSLPPSLDPFSLDRLQQSEWIEEEEALLREVFQMSEEGDEKEVIKRVADYFPGERETL